MIRTTKVAMLVSACSLFAAPVRAEDYFAEANPTTVEKAPPPNPDRGLRIGLRSGYGLPFGKPYDADETLRGFVNGVIPIWVDAGYRFNPSIYVGAYGVFGYGLVHTTETQCGTGVSCSAYDVRVGVDAQYRFLPKGAVDPWIGLGFGYEWLHYGVSGFGVTRLQTLRGFELFGIQLGADFELDKSFRLGPFIGYSVGKFGDGSKSETGSATSGAVAAGIANTAMHEWLTLGLRGVLDI
jgi:hypothetical protein